MDQTGFEPVSTAFQVIIMTFILLALSSSMFCQPHPFSDQRTVRCVWIYPAIEEVRDSAIHRGREGFIAPIIDLMVNWSKSNRV